LALVIATGLTFGGYFLWDRVSRVSATELEVVIQRDAVPFDLPSIPDEILDRLASNQVVIVGETHFLQEHRDLVAQLLKQLHGRGFRQLLVEWTQAADWLLTDFVSDGGLEPDWVPPNGIFAGDIATVIRDFNRTLPDGEHFQLHPIDVTIDEYGGAQSFVGSLEALADNLLDPGPLSMLLASDYAEEENQQTARLESVLGELDAGRSDLVGSWGEPLYETVVQLVEVELQSVVVRSAYLRDYDEGVRLREEAIKRMADARLQGNVDGTLINFGSTHAQKERLRGTDIEWLGDYLVHRSQAFQGSVIVLEVSAAYVMTAPGSGLPDSDLTVSPENELFRVMNETWPDRIVFLPADDRLFSSGRVPMNFEGAIYVSAPKRQYDVFVLLPLAHRVPSGP
jgi:hypothetical protein